MSFVAAAGYWLATELPRIEHLAHLCTSGEDSYLRVAPSQLWGLGPRARSAAWMHGGPC